VRSSTLPRKRKEKRVRTTMDIELWRELHAEMLREAENERLARRSRTNDYRRKAHGLWKLAIHRMGLGGEVIREANVTRESL
jgi:hypothetical protein